MTGKLVTTGEVARAIGVDPATVSRWVKRGLIEPETFTAGGQARFDLENVREQLREIRNRD